jgi:hypothetical protein
MADASQRTRVGNAESLDLIVSKRIFKRMIKIIPVPMTHFQKGKSKPKSQ